MLVKTLVFRCSIAECIASVTSASSDFIARQKPLDQFVWNSYLLEPLKGHVHDDWLVYLIHGFLSQVSEYLYCQFALQI